ncbi:hypothetical protein SBD_1356 [Streptomyces bottropensis ATCC 25435]|uniref:Uncharacterized protein n=1 Tax=Streptomyces bottropensis ATCC 25435 TaxID=1054862 RepID=M3FY89_9ACTN|nr:hypothetical protein SBD_1356 [Streptomyces bottropensis ATCC 25435]
MPVLPVMQRSTAPDHSFVHVPTHERMHLRMHEQMHVHEG